MTESNVPGTLFSEHFLDKNLVDFAECSAHYEHMPVDDLAAELDFLFRPEIQAIPFGFSGRRYYAFLIAIVNAAADTRLLSDSERSRLVSLALIIRENVRTRTAETGRAAFDQAWMATLERVRNFGLFPLVADLLEKGLSKYEGPFIASGVGEVLERER